MKKEDIHNMTNSIIIEHDYEHDYRKDIVERKLDKEYWGNWDSWNILYKTLAYEISSSRDVESYWYVRDALSALYDEELETYVGSDYTFDVMNGWWNCFKVLFKLGDRKAKDTKTFIENMMKDIVDIKEKKDLIDFISKQYALKGETVKNLLLFLEVVYTCGNIAPVPKGGNRHADDWDSWEYKLNSSFLIYKCANFEEYFHFGEYLFMLI